MGSSNDMTTTGSRGRSPLVKPGCAKEIDLSLGRQEVNGVIFAAALMVGMNFAITMLTAMKKTLTMMMMMLMTMTSRRRVITRLSCRKCQALVVRKSHIHCSGRSLERIFIKAFKKEFL